ncbi:phospholipase D family protein [Chitinasiproducens palmae]|uniref:phospholipase D family protein n=1 Tax=Chitinasiproducens palmae TaxID=1770053 RepID=UPI001F223B80|nr:phospholipase D family protein [Chitinasiproducens palmae]
MQRVWKRWIRLGAAGMRTPRRTSSQPLGGMAGHDSQAGRYLQRLFLLTATCMLAACASQRLPATAYPRAVEFALPASTPSALNATLTPLKAAHPGESGFKLLVKGSDALGARIALARSAQRTLDLQYYIADVDETGKLLLEAALRAAERGVRVRMLFDDMNFKDHDSTIAVLDASPNIEVRIFNPFGTAAQGPFGKVSNLFTSLDTLTRRMHNKAMIADNQVAIVGGRNVGDSYFDASHVLSFRDLDIVAAGDIVPPISRSFDLFWNSAEAYPLRALKPIHVDREEMARVREDLKRHWEESVAITGGAHLEEPPLARQIRTGEMPLTWAKARFWTDTPDKIVEPTDDYVSPPAKRLGELMQQAQQEFLLISAYFVPHQHGVDMMSEMVRRGVKVSVLTNSLAATDAPAVQAGYNPFRVPLLKNGVSLYEYKPSPGSKPRTAIAGSKSRASLHAKTYVIDRRTVVIGSLNFDPRSVGLNTEVALEIESPPIAAQVVELFDETASLDESYHVVLADQADRDALAKTGAPDSPLIWITEENGHILRYNFDPDAGFKRNAMSALFTILPLDDQL